MRKIRVLIVDDSTVVRRLISDALASDEAIEIAGTASNGKLALDKLPQVCPDVVTMDIEMPGLDGLATLPLLRKMYPTLPVIMFSTLTRKGAVDTLNALSLGASDYVTKPSNVGSVNEGLAAIKQELIPRIKALCPFYQPAAPSHGTAKAKVARTVSRTPGKVSLLAIGVSTGGPNALTEIFAGLPANFPVPILIVQHMPPVFTRYLAERLSAVSAVKVWEATGGELLRPGVAYLAPGNFHMQLHSAGNGWTTRLNQLPMENSCRPAVDVLFRSVASVVGSQALALVLTGMGQDGLRGSEAIHHAGGRVLAQDQATSVVWGMPGSVVNAGLADQILPLSKIAGELIRLTQDSHSFTRSFARMPTP
jgi:two-component system chemotaxis response regulator CheB